MITVKLHVCARCGVPHVPEEIRSRVAAGEKITVEIIHVSGVAGNVLKHSTGALNIDACRVAAPGGLTSGGSCVGNSALHMNRDAGILEGRQRSQEHAAGRWPANVVLSDCDEVLEAFAAFGISKSVGGSRGAGGQHGRYGKIGAQPDVKPGFGDTGTAARFFYSAKASKHDRMGTTHPTTKPTSLIEWLSKLVCPPGGTILDPFAGSGTLAVAAHRLGFDAILIEREAEYVEMIEKRLAVVRAESKPVPADDQMALL